MKKCRICNENLSQTPLLEYPNSPKSAQQFSAFKSKKVDSITLKIFQCPSCGIIQHDCRPVSYYKNVIRAVSFSPSMVSYRKKQLKSWIKKNNLNNKKIIEIGNGTGEYLEILKSIEHKKIYGLEHNLKNFNKLKKRYNITRGFLDKKLKKISGSPFDGFLIFSFLEHWPNAKKSLIQLSQSLSTDAKGIIEVPNFELIKNKGLFTEFVTDHILYFDLDTFRNFLECSGFRVINIKKIWSDYIISAEIEKREPLNIKIFKEKFISIKSSLQEYVKKNKDTVIWGAGHQALTTISLSGISKNIKYIVDSAKFKQNLYAPGSKLKILDPTFLNIDKPKSIIIMGAGYSDEILKIVQNKYKFIKSIVVLREDYLKVIQ